LAWLLSAWFDFQWLFSERGVLVGVYFVVVCRDSGSTLWLRYLRWLATSLNVRRRGRELWGNRGRCVLLSQNPLLKLVANLAGAAGKIVGWPTRRANVDSG
jgi:hypothetical protein